SGCFCPLPNVYVPPTHNVLLDGDVESNPG
nr:2A1 [Seal picornavirus type 1]